MANDGKSPQGSVDLRLRRARSAIFLGRLCAGTLTWLVVSLGVWLVLFGLDNLIDLPNGLRFPLAVGGLVAVVYVFLKQVATPLVRMPSLERTALLLERRYGTQRNALINSFQLERRDLKGRAGVFARHTVFSGKKELSNVNSRELWQVPRLVRFLATVAVLAACWTGYVGMAGGKVLNAARRFANPFGDIPPLGNVALTVHPGQNVTVMESDDLDIIVLVEQRADDKPTPGGYPKVMLVEGVQQVAPRLDYNRCVSMSPLTAIEILEKFTARTGQPGTAENVKVAGTDFEKRALRENVTAFAHRAKEVRQAFAFRVFHEKGGTYSRSAHVSVQPAPRITSSQFHVTPPTYTGVERVSSLGPPRAVSGLAGSKVQIEIGLDLRAEQVTWEAFGVPVPFVSRDGLQVAETVLTKSGPYVVRSDGAHLKRPIVLAAGGIAIRDDQFPRIEFLTDTHNQAVIPGDRLRLRLSASDDFGLARVVLTMRPAMATDALHTLKEWTFDTAPGHVGPFHESFAVTLDPSLFVPGSEYILEAVCTDFHPDIHEAKTRPYLVRVHSLEEIAQAAEGVADDNLLAALDHTIQLQQKSLSDTRNVVQYLDDILGAESEGRPATYTFPRHHATIAQSQGDVRRTLEEALGREREDERVLAEKLRSLNDNEIASVLGDIAALNDWHHWLQGLPPSLRGGTFARNSDIATAPPAKGRFAAVVVTESHQADSASAGELSFLDAGGNPLPREFIRGWQFTSRVRVWPDPSEYLPMEPGKLDEIVAEARKALITHSDQDYIDIVRMTDAGKRDSGAVYAVRTIKAEKARQVQFLGGHDDALRVWLNGKLLAEGRGGRSAVPDTDICTLDLQAGDNTLLLECANIKGGWGFYARLQTPGGQRLGLSHQGKLTPVGKWQIAYVAQVAAPGEPWKAIDGNRGSWWHAAGPLPHALIVDLGSEHAVGGVRYGPAPRSRDGIKAFDLYVTPRLTAGSTLPVPLRTVEKQQTFILDQLISLRGLEAKKHELAATPPPTQTLDGPEMPPVALEEKLEDFLEDVKQYKDESLDISRKRNALLDQYGEDLSEEQEEELKDLKLQEARLAKSLDLSVQDVSTLGSMDMADSQQSEALQTILEKGEDLADVAEEKAKKQAVDNTFNLDTATVLLVEEIMQNGEVTLPPIDVLKSGVEQAEDEKNALPITQLPHTLEDMLAEIDQAQDEVEGDVEDVGTALKSGDFGEGPVAPGSTSSMNAQGKTGAVEPDNKTEVEGRSGFGRTGKANGTGVEDVAKAIPDNKGAAPERNTPTPLEEGDVKDEDPDAAANATGLGKKTDDTIDFGMNGKLPPKMLEKMKATRKKQQLIRESAEDLVMKLRHHNLPTADLEQAVQAMKQVEQALQHGDAEKLRQAYSEAAGLTGEARQAVAQVSGLRYMQERVNTRENAGEHVRGRSAPPREYEQMVGAFFKELAKTNDGESE